MILGLPVKPALCHTVKVNYTDNPLSREEFQGPVDGPQAYVGHLLSHPVIELGCRGVRRGALEFAQDRLSLPRHPWPGMLSGIYAD